MFGDFQDIYLNLTGIRLRDCSITAELNLTGISLRDCNIVNVITISIFFMYFYGTSRLAVLFSSFPKCSTKIYAWGEYHLNFSRLIWMIKCYLSPHIRLVNWQVFLFNSFLLLVTGKTLISGKFTQTLEEAWESPRKWRCMLFFDFRLFVVFEFR